MFLEDIGGDESMCICLYVCMYVCTYLNIQMRIKELGLSAAIAPLVPKVGCKEEDTPDRSAPAGAV